MDVAVLASRRAGAIFYGRNHPDETSGHSKLVVAFGIEALVAFGCISGCLVVCMLGFTTRGCIQLGEDILQLCTLRNDFESSLIRI